jgi:cysteine desulfurase/selenocysteine lyase
MIYLDNASTSYPKPKYVYDCLDNFARNKMGNPWKDQHELAVASQEIMENARVKFNEFFKGSSPQAWVHTASGTDSSNMAIKGVLAGEDHVVTTDLEHDSITRPLRSLEKNDRLKITIVKSKNGYVEPNDIEKAINDYTRLVCVTHVSNVLGTIQPIEEISKVVYNSKALFLVDAAQSAGMVPIDLTATPIDLLVISGHKMLYGPTGTGLLYVGEKALPKFWREGDTGGPNKNEYQPRQLPYRLEAGTPNVLGIAGLSKGLEYVISETPDNIRKHCVDLLQIIMDKLDYEKWCPAGAWDRNKHSNVLSLIPLDHRDTEEYAKFLGSQDIAIKGGIMDSPRVHRSFGTYPSGMIRVSPGPFNIPDDIYSILNIINKS